MGNRLQRAAPYTASPLLVVTIGIGGLCGIVGTAIKGSED
jgi:hypothetical protein